MNDIAELAKDIRAEKVARARNMSLSEKFLAGAELFEQACEVACAGIRAMNPEWSDAQVDAELKRRLEIGRKTKGAALAP